MRTVEVRFRGKSQYFLSIRVMRLSALESIIRKAHERAVSVPGMVSDPGSWAILLGHAALLRRSHVYLARDSFGTPDAVVMVHPSPMVGQFYHWPDVFIGKRQIEARNERALALGPSDQDLTVYGKATRIDADFNTLRRMFDMGVLEWKIPDLGRAVLVATSHKS